MCMLYKTIEAIELDDNKVQLQSDSSCTISLKREESLDVKNLEKHFV